MGLERNLSAGEIVAQVWWPGRVLAPGARITHVVYMGMGEPLANYSATVKSLRLLTDPHAFGFSPRRITVSTVGLVSGIERLARESLKVNLAISLHATSNEIRDRIMPVNRGFAIEELLAACRRFPLPFRQRMTFEYVLLDGVNDAVEDAQAAGAPPAGDPRQDQPDPVQRLGGLGLRAATAAAHPRLPGGPARARPHRHDPVEQGRGHRRGLRAAPRGGAGMSGPVTVALATLGCRLNQVESQEMGALLEGRGFQAVPAGRPRRSTWSTPAP